MTCREKLMIEQPDFVGEDWIGGCCGCPDAEEVGYLKRPSWCNDVGDEDLCRRCWDREIPEVPTEPTIKDSGERRQFDTGAVRDIQEGKGRCDLMPLDVVALQVNTGADKDCVLQSIYLFTNGNDIQYLYLAVEHFRNMLGCDMVTVLLEVAKHFEEGAKKYGEYNWQKGIPTHCYIDSAVRHYLKWLRGDEDEPHHRAFVWNILCCIWTCTHKPELNDYRKTTENTESCPICGDVIPEGRQTCPTCERW